MVAAVIAVTDLTTQTIDGTGVFDVMMKTVKAHLKEEYDSGRIKGNDYSTVYLGALQGTMDRALQFVLSKDKVNAELAVVELEKARITAENLNIPKVGLKIDAETLLVEQQTDNLVAQGLNIPKEGVVLDKQALKLISDTVVSDKQSLQLIAETTRVNQTVTNLVTENTNLGKQGLLIDNQKLQVAQQTTNLVAEALNIPKQGTKIDNDAALIAAQTLIVPKQGLQTEAQTLLVTEQKDNAVLQGLNLTKEGCKLDAEFDVLEQQVLKVTAETTLLTQKKVTELAQVNSSGVDADSVIGKQKALYTAQTTGFTRDAELKVAGKLIDTWNVRRTTDDAVVADAGNGLLDANILRAVNKMLDGVGA